MSFRRFHRKPLRHLHHCKLATRFPSKSPKIQGKSLRIPFRPAVFDLVSFLFRIKYQKFIARKNRASVYRSQIVNFWKEFVARTNFFYAEKIDGQWKFINRNHNRASVYRSQIVSFKKEFVTRTNFFYAEWLTGNENSLPALYLVFSAIS